MERYRTRAHAEAIQSILTKLPHPIQRMLDGVHVVTGYDPAWLGLHYFTDTGDGRNYTEVSHCVWKHHQQHFARDRRETTVVLTSAHVHMDWIVLHEFGHALDERLGMIRPKMQPINAYAARNTWEAFAEAFRAWCNDTRDDVHYNRTDLLMLDSGAVAFFDALAEVR